MLSRLAGLAVLVPAAAVGLAAQPVIWPIAYAMAWQQHRTPDLELPLPARLAEPTEPTEQVAA
jgi:hypothetical protein